MKPEYVTPELNLESFNCINCHVFSRQHWYFMQSATQSSGYGGQQCDKQFRTSYCENCGQVTIWKDSGQIIYPNHSIAEPPSPDLPQEVQDDYDEARGIANMSPRGAAALLRLAIQKLCKHLGKPGQNINSDIAALVADGLPPRVQEALDSVRLIGNDAVHPGTLDLRDDTETVLRLFKLVNFIATKMITEPREIDELYGGLPAGKRDAVARRDGSA